MNKRSSVRNRLPAIALTLVLASGFCFGPFCHHVQNAFAQGVSASEILPREFYERAWHLMSEKYNSPSHFSAHWATWHYDGLLTTEEEAVAAVKELLSKISDDLVELVPVNQQTTGSAGCAVAKGLSSPAYFVNRITKDSPAARAGIHIWDKILEVDSVAMNPNLSRSEAMQMLTGKSGQAINIRVERDNETYDIPVTLSDQDPEPNSYFAMLQNHYAYVKPAFPLWSRAKLDELKDAIAQLKQSSAAGVILDLRSNTEDMTDIAELCGIFVGNKPAYATHFKGNYEPHNGVGEALTNLPIVALIDSNTNTSAQALAACLKSNKRATLMGDDSFGSNICFDTESLNQNYKIRFPMFKYLTLDDSSGSFACRQNPDIYEVVYPKEIEDGPWWNVSIDGNAPSPLSGKDVVLNLALNEISIQSGISKGPRQTPRRQPSPSH